MAAHPSTPDPEPPAPQPPAAPAPPPRDQVEDVIRAAKMLALALSARALLAMSLIGAFILGLCAMFSDGWRPVVVLAAYCLATVVPVVALEIRKRAS